MDRYQRQTVLPEIGAAGQQRLSAARVVVIGCGGLGSPVAAYLAGAGVGHLVLVDGDRVRETNLHRQVFFSSGAGAGKVEGIKAHCTALNPEIKIEAHAKYLSPENVRPLLANADLVVECTDDAGIKHLVSDACHLLRVPLVYGAVHKYEGYLALFPNQVPDDPHLRDLYPAPDPTTPDCATVGVLPTAVGIIALLQANAALCYLLGIGRPPVNQLLTYNAMDNQQHRVTLRKTYGQPITPPWAETTRRPSRAELETEASRADFPTYAGVFSMLDEEREPELEPGVTRLSKRDPLGQCLVRMTDGKRYLIYCNSGKLSLMLAAQIRKARPAVEALSWRGGLMAVLLLLVLFSSCSSPETEAAAAELPLEEVLDNWGTVPSLNYDVVQTWDNRFAGSVDRDTFTVCLINEADRYQYTVTMDDQLEFYRSEVAQFSIHHEKGLIERTTGADLLPLSDLMSNIIFFMGTHVDRLDDLPFQQLPDDGEFRQYAREYGRYVDGADTTITAQRLIVAASRLAAFHQVSRKGTDTIQHLSAYFANYVTDPSCATDPEENALVELQEAGYQIKTEEELEQLMLNQQATIGDELSFDFAAALADFPSYQPGRKTLVMASFIGCGPCKAVMKEI